MYKFQIKKMKNLIFKTATTISIFSLSLFNAKPVLTDTYVYGSNSTRPDSLKVTFYELGVSNSDFTKIFPVLNSTSGVEVDIADENSVNNMITNVKPVPGTYTHLYSVISNTYKVKGSSNGCYTKNVNVNHTDSIFTASISTKNGSFLNTGGGKLDAWPAASSNSSDFGEASVTENVFGVGPDGESDQPTANDAYGPLKPSTNLSVGGNEVKSAVIYLTNSSAPYDFVPGDTLRADIPAASTRNRMLYLGELSSPVVVNDGSKGVVQIYFDYSNGLAFDDNCEAIKFNSGDFDMSVITE
tara:strand:+ start:210 stop:1106 length:897 start_codon:yes stop_codon:yes gene_type:complete